VSHSAQAWKSFRWIAFLSTLLLLVLLVGRLVERSLGGTREGIESGLDRVLSTLTRSDTRVVAGRAEITATEEVAELVLAELQMSATRRFENEAFFFQYLPAGTKTLIVRGRYRVTAGYRLEPGVSLRVEDGVPVASFPPAEILGVELTDFEVLSESEGWANSITPEDRATLLRELREQMREEAQASGILDTVNRTLHTRLRDLLATPEVRIEPSS